VQIRPTVAFAAEVGRLRSTNQVTHLAAARPAP
jgi:hypothetical protein